jgi:hypothetical protein
MALSAGADQLRRHGMATGGTLVSPAGLPWLWTGVMALGLQLLLVKIVSQEVSETALLVWAIFASHLLLLPFLVRNARYIGVKLIVVGLSLNLLVMAANGGMMPVSAAGIAAVGQQDSAQPGERVTGSKDFYSDSPRLSLLSDRIILRLPNHFVRVISFGDLVIALGTFCALASVSRKLMLSPRTKSAEAI